MFSFDEAVLFGSVRTTKLMSDVLIEKVSFECSVGKLGGCIMYTSSFKSP